MLQEKDILSYEQIIESLKSTLQSGHAANIAFMGISGNVGATDVTENLARTLSFAHQNILLIHLLAEDGEALPTKKGAGFIGTLAGAVPDDSGVTHIKIPASCLRRPDFAEGGLFEDTLKKIKEKHNLVLWDLPPADKTIQSFMIAKHTQGVVLIAHSGKTRWQAAQALIDHLKFGDCKILGIILNKQKTYIPGWIYRLLFHYS